MTQPVCILGPNKRMFGLTLSKQNEQATGQWCLLFQSVALSAIGSQAVETSQCSSQDYRSLGPSRKLFSGKIPYVPWAHMVPQVFTW